MFNIILNNTLTLFCVAQINFRFLWDYIHIWKLGSKVPAGINTHIEEDLKSNNKAYMIVSRK